MSKSTKPKEEIKVETAKPAVEHIVEVKNEQADSVEIPKIFIPDIPAQIIEEKKEDISVPESPKGESEIEFLKRILFIQENGGFGMHLHPMIKERIKTLN